MSARRFSGFLLLFLVLQTACSRLDNTRTRAPATRVPLAAAHQFYQVPIGLCEDYPEESRTLTSARKDLELLKRHQVPVLRIAFGWDAMEPERGRFDWSFWDEFVHLATEEYGLRLIPYICYTPAWAAARPGEDAWREPPADVNLFAAFVRQLVTRYRDKIDSWEIWNEPDNPHYWLGSVEQYAALLAAGSQAVRQADPHAKVVLGGLAWNLDFLEAMLTNSATMRDVDVVNLHNYYETWSSDAVEQLPQYVGRARDILKRHQRPLPIWMAEIGYSSYRQNGRVSPQFHPHLNYAHTPAHQANTLFRALTLLLATEQVDLVAWYRINDLPVKQDIIG
ncbi:MAG TPA: beta-galactosidase, partial [Clostridia bacterium]|nr:beta-galactosidase [Clostridia bacterium]